MSFMPTRRRSAPIFNSLSPKRSRERRASIMQGARKMPKMPAKMKPAKRSAKKPARKKQARKFPQKGPAAKSIPYAVVTTFSKEGFNAYGVKFLNTFLNFWKDIPIHVYWEGDDYPGQHPNIIWHNLNLDKDRAAFIKRHPGEETDYRQAAKRFCHKVFALTDPERLKIDVDTWIWLDADVKTIAPVDKAFLDSVCPKGFVGSYLGRKDWPHSECGFVSYRGKDGRKFLAMLRHLYVSDELFKLPETHDSFAFDRLREGLKGKWHNISEGVPGMHVWDDCPLRQKMKH